MAASAPTRRRRRCLARRESARGVAQQHLHHRPGQGQQPSAAKAASAPRQPQVAHDRRAVSLFSRKPAQDSAGSTGTLPTASRERQRPTAASRGRARTISTPPGGRRAESRTGIGKGAAGGSRRASIIEGKGCFGAGAALRCAQMTAAGLAPKNGTSRQHCRSKASLRPWPYRSKRCFLLCWLPRPGARMPRRPRQRSARSRQFGRREGGVPPAPAGPSGKPVSSSWWSAAVTNWLAVGLPAGCSLRSARSSPVTSTAARCSYSDQLDVSEHLAGRGDGARRCSDACPGLFSQLKEVYLFGCNTLNAEAIRYSVSEVGRSLVRAGYAPAIRPPRRAPDQRHGESSRDRMRRGIQGRAGDLRLFLDRSTRPTAANRLDRYFQSAPAAELGSGRASSRLLGQFAAESMIVVSGHRRCDPARRLSPRGCQFSR